MNGRRASTIAAAAIAIFAVVAVLAWPSYVNRGTNAARAAALPTMAPVVADYQTRGKLIAFWERAAGEHHPGDMLSPRILAGQYLQRYRETGDIADVLRAEAEAKRSLAAQPRGNLGGELELASAYLTLHRFRDALAVTKHVESWDRGDASMLAREASLDMEIGDYARAERLLAAVREKDRDDGWRVVDARYLELTGHLAEARAVLATASAYLNQNFDAPAQQRAWTFLRQGEMAFEAGDTAAALAFEHQALVVFPHYADAFRVLARIECSQHDWKACLSDAQSSADLVPYPEALGYQADAQRALGDRAAAERTDALIGAVQTLGDSQHVTDRLLAIYYSEHGLRTHDAYRIAKNDLRARDDIFTEDTLAWAAAMDGRWDEAQTAIRKATRYGTENSLIDYHAGAIAAHFGRRDEARHAFERALARNPHFHPAYADAARAALAT